MNCILDKALRYAGNPLPYLIAAAALVPFVGVAGEVAPYLKAVSEALSTVGLILVNPSKVLDHQQQ